jgi:predicted dehydrogenase
MSAPRRVRLGFVGVGWIGLHRMRALLESGVVEARAICEPEPSARAAALQLAPAARVCEGLSDMLALGLDGVVIATPSAQHAREAELALSAGAAVFCQKPLGRDAGETRRVVACAREADRLLAVDFCYRHTEAFAALARALASERLGQIFSARFVFHNAYGPDKPWYFDPALSGGGCGMDLGIHLVDAAQWLLGGPRFSHVRAQRFARGERLRQPRGASEDYLVAQLETERGCLVELACSWNLSAGCDAVIGAELHGTRGGVAVSNVGGSFYDLRAEERRGTQRSSLAEPPDAWGGRAAVAWARQLARDVAFDPSAHELVAVAETLDRIYDAS